MQQFKDTSNSTTEKIHEIYKQLKTSEDGRNEEIIKNVKMNEEVILTQREMENLRVNEIGSLHTHMTKLNDQIQEMEITRDAKRKQYENE